jgi:hypothetical protein
MITYGSVFQLAEKIDLKSIKYGFESHRSYHKVSRPTESPSGKVRKDTFMVKMDDWDFILWKPSYQDGSV